jgi:hypothetical protein
MSGTLPSANKPSVGGRVIRGAARGALKLGRLAFNKMFPIVGRAMGTSGDNQPDSINTSGEDISRSLFRQRALFRSILDNQMEQNRLLERLLLVYKNKQPVSMMASPTGAPPPAPSSNIGMELPMPDLPDRPSQRPQAQQRPNRQRSLLRRYLTFLKRRSPRLFKAAARRLSVAFASLAVPGPGWLIAIITGIGSLFLAAELLQIYREFRNSNSEDEDEGIENDLPTEEEAAAEERLLQQERERELFGDVSEMGDTQNLAQTEQAVFDAQRQESERRRTQAGLAGNLQDPVRQRLMEQLAAAERSLARRSTPVNRTRVDNLKEQLARHDAANPISERDAELVQEPAAPAGFIGPPRPSREELIANRNSQIEADLAAARGEAEREETPPAALDMTLSNAADNAETLAMAAIIDDAIRQAENIAAGPMADPVAPAIAGIRVEGNTIIYDFDSIKYDAYRIKFDGLTLPTQQVAAQVAAPPPPATSGTTSNVSASPAAAPTGRRAIQIMTPTLSALPPTTSTPGATAVPLTAPAAATQPDASAVTPPVTGTTAQILSTIRIRESGGNYQAQARGSTASGAYQFIDGTWRSVTRKFNVGTEYQRAVEAPPAVQDAVAAAYVNDILRANNNRVEVVPLVWYTGNAQGRMSEAALAANRGLTAETYQRNWMAAFAAQGGTVGQTQVAQAPAAGPAMAQASTSRVVADRQQAMNTQRVTQTFNQQQQQTPTQQAKQDTPRIETAEVPLRNRVLSAFNHLAQAS